MISYCKSWPRRLRARIINFYIDPFKIRDAKSKISRDDSTFILAAEEIKGSPEIAVTKAW
jgi:hypothetical protein